MAKTTGHLWHPLQHGARERSGRCSLSSQLLSLLKDFKNDLYLKLARNFLRFRWLLTYLYGAAPLAEAGFYSQEYPQPIRSFRNSDYGYVNDENIQVSYTSLEQYVTDIENYVQSGELSAEKNFTQPFASVDRSTIAPIWSRVSPIWNSAASISILLTIWALAKRP